MDQRDMTEQRVELPEAAKPRRRTELVYDLAVCRTRATRFLFGMRGPAQPAQLSR
jgi:hypothetical protein